MSGGRDPTNVVDSPGHGELRESVWSNVFTLGVDEQTIAASLRSHWVYVGFIVDPGDAIAVGLTATIRILEPMLQGKVAAVPIVNGIGAQAFIGFTVGARCELVVRNATGSPVTGIKCQLWGMGRGGMTER
jgi:hypothetical protein